MDFLNAAPKWPLAETLNKRAEHALYVRREPAELILSHFAKRKPASPEGMLALARAQRESGNESEARSLVRKAWLTPAVDAALEKAVIAEFGTFLGSDDHRRRTWRLIYDQQSNAAIRNAKRAGGDVLNAAKAAQLLLRGHAAGEKQYRGLSSAMREQPAMKYALVRYYRKLERFSKARAIVATIPSDPAIVGDAEAWWVERRIIARRSVGISHKDTVKTAYAIARAHGFDSGPNAVEGEFLAGWIALRSLQDPERAMPHFKKLADVAPTRTEKARAKYWIGRTYAALGDKTSAASAYRDAAQHSTVYYGQLAREQIGLGSEPEKIPSGAASADARARVDGDEVIRAFKMVQAAKDKSSLGMFLWPISTRFDGADEMNAAAAIVHKAGGTTMSLRLAKASAARNIDIDDWGYPVKAMPAWKQIGKPVEKALVYGLSRQESEFDPKAGSKVGAQGLMQLMPGTAKLVARQYRLSYAPSKLTGDPAYNVKLGAAHLADLVEDYNGSYVLTLVAYNAGPRRSREWVAEYGDPRNGQVDPIDWVESIPFQETRQYVQKVLQNTHIYRSRLAPNTVRPMTADLRRGAPSAVAVAASGETVSESCGGPSVAALISNCE
ncbi:MAG: lytic transglycosylase domain-containing protein [Rhizobiales bacterium]|nr:lytic transglycosylase domain-containing protein [Hyphomicrobiales bacterium]